MATAKLLWAITGRLIGLLLITASAYLTLVGFIVITAFIAG
jgi:hypothetical protein